MNLPLALAALALAPAPAPFPQDASVLERADEQFCSDTGERGLDGWMSWFAADALILTHSGDTISDLAAARAYYASLAFPPAGFSWTPDAALLAGSGELGYTAGHYEIRGPDPAGAVLQSGRYVTVWQRQPDGAYRVVADSGGRADFRTRLEELPGPPLALAYRAERSAVAASGELAFTAGTWTAKAEGADASGKYLTVWKRAGEDAWEVVAEMGFDH